jgi:hypothetical protein
MTNCTKIHVAKSMTNCRVAVEITSDKNAASPPVILHAFSCRASGDSGFPSTELVKKRVVWEDFNITNEPAFSQIGKLTAQSSSRDLTDGSARSLAFCNIDVSDQIRSQSL